MKNAIYMFFLAICAIILGGFLGDLVANTDGLRWLAYSRSFAFEPGTFLDLSILTLTFGITFTINIAQIIFIVAAIIIYYKTAPKIFAK